MFYMMCTTYQVDKEFSFCHVMNLLCSSSLILLNSVTSLSGGNFFTEEMNYIYLHVFDAAHLKAPFRQVGRNKYNTRRTFILKLGKS